MAEKIAMIKYLENLVKSLETDHSYQIKEMETEHNDKVRDLHTGYCSAIQDLKDKNQVCAFSYISITTILLIVKMFTSLAKNDI